MESIWIIDDDRDFASGLKETLEDAGYSSEIFWGLAMPTTLLEQGELPRLIFLDLRLGAEDGLKFLEFIADSDLDPEVVVVILTAYADSHNTIRAMSLGAFDHLTKPVGANNILAVVKKALAFRKQSETKPLHIPEFDQNELLGNSPAMRALQKWIGLFAAHDENLLITGETGTGKELVARAIHRYGNRRQKPFVSVNCAAIPKDLVESELFGHVKGSFSGAMKDYQGRFTEAEGGILFLDEIGEIPLPLQSKLLRILQEKRLRPVGGEKEFNTNVRILAATNKDLGLAVKNGDFREDLYYRLNVFHIQIPALRERISDVPLLGQTFLNRETNGRKSFREDAISALLDYDWPGNVRQLENLVKRLAVSVRNNEIGSQDISLEFRALDNQKELHSKSLPERVYELEEKMVRSALLQSSGNRSEASRILGIHRQLLYRKIKEFGLEDLL